MLQRIVSLLALAVSLHFSGAMPAEQTFTSSAQKTHLIELFTSEGCSSCPPAEAWLSKLTEEPRLWRDFVPIAFHVDYWDRLGWRDPFASKQWTARQYAYSARWKSGSVYTPEFVLDGREWRNSGVPNASWESVGVLKVSVADDDVVTFDFASAGAGRTFELHLARLGFGLNINVKAGENSGRKLVHDFVVLALVTEPINATTKTIRLPPAGMKLGPNTRQAIAAWVTEAGQMEPIQAIGAWLQ